MPRRLRYTDDALADLDDARACLTQPGSGFAAQRKLVAMRRDIRRLRLEPCLWPIGNTPGVRELPAAGGYRVFYKVDPDTCRSADAGDVLALRIYGPGQDRRGFDPSDAI